MEKIAALWNLFRKGEAVANPQAWETGKVTGGMVAGLLGALVLLAKAFGYNIPLSDDQLATLGSSVIVVVGLFIHPAISAITSPDRGILPAKGQPVQADTGTPVQTISEADVRAGIDFADKAAGQPPAGRGQNVE